MSSSQDRFSAEAAAWDSNPYMHRMTEEAWAAIQRAVPELTEGGAAAAATTTRSSEKKKKLDVLEVGAGTGLLTLKTAPHARALVAVDVAEGMIGELKRKLDLPENANHTKNVLALHTELTGPEDGRLPPGLHDEEDEQWVAATASDEKEEKEKEGRMKFDLVTSHLVLHHIPDLEGVLRDVVFGCLRPGGVAALTDFEDFGPEAKRFHPRGKMDGVARHGIPKGGMEEMMRRVGFVDVEVEVAWRANKAVERWDGEFEGVAKGERDEDKGAEMEFSYLLCFGRKP